jgi:hypothetical protein
MEDGDYEYSWSCVTKTGTSLVSNVMVTR